MKESGKTLSRRDFLKELPYLGGVLATAFYPLSPELRSGRAYPILSVDTQKPFVSLTLDDGNFAEALEKLIKYTERFGTLFTLFPTGRSLRTLPDLWRELKKQGHEIGNHSHSHINVEKHTTSEVLADFREFEKQDYPDTFGEDYTKPGFARVPQARAIFENVQRALWSLNDLNVHWKLDTYSWKASSTPKTRLEQIQRAESGDIIVAHLIDKDVDQLTTYLEAIKAKGFKNVLFTKLWDTSIAPYFKFNTEPVIPLDPYIESEKHYGGYL